MPNQYINKVQFGDQTIMDITDTSANAQDVLEGEVFYNSAGARTVGALGDATQSTHGLMSAADKQKLDTIIDDTADSTSTTSTWSAAKVAQELAAAVPTSISDLINDSDFLTEALLGANSGIATLDASGKIPSSQLPSYVDDVIEAAQISAFPATGESGKIYVALDTNKTYRWSGSTYVEISESLALGETESTAYRGDRGKVAYDHAAAKGSAYASGLYKITTNAEGHITAAEAVTKTDITGLGIPAQDTTYQSLAAAENGADISLVSTGEKYVWNNSYLPLSGGTISGNLVIQNSLIYSGISAAGDNITRPLWFSAAENGSIVYGRPVYDSNFTYNPSTDTLSIGTGSLTATNYSGTAAKATADADGNTISSSYLKLSGGTMTGQLIVKGIAADNPIITRGITGSDGNGNTGDLHLNWNGGLVLLSDGGQIVADNGTLKATKMLIYQSSTTTDNLGATLAFSNKDTTINREQNVAYIAAYNTHANNNDGMNLVIRSGGAVFIGGGESPSSLYALKTATTEESLYLTADGTLYAYANAQTITNRIGFAITTAGAIVPQKAEAINNNAQNIGASDNKWANVYATTFNGALSGNATTASGATKLINQGRKTSSDLTHITDGGMQLLLATSSMTTSKPATDGYILHFHWDTSSAWDSQLFISDSGASMQYRGSSAAGTWTSWKTLIDSSNYTTYTVKQDGTGATGTWSIGISGNAATSTTSTYLSVPRVTESGKTLPGANKITIKEYASTATDIPSAHYYHVFTIQGPDTKYGSQLALGMTTAAAYYRVYNNSTWGSWQSIINTDTKNTAGSTNSTSKLFLIGATSQAANPTTNSYSKVFEINGALSAKTLGINADTDADKVTLQWNSTDQSVDFVFA